MFPYKTTEPFQEFKSFDDKAPKYISFKPIASGNWIRGRDKSLGAEYTKERIEARIEDNQKELLKEKIPFPKRRKKTILKDYAKQRLIDTDNEKFKNSPGLRHWADIQNLKIAASSSFVLQKARNYSLL